MDESNPDDFGRADTVNRAADFVSEHWPHRPQALIVLGSGLGGLTAEIESAVAIPFEQIPHVAPSTAAGHQGQLIGGRLAGVDVLVQQGRLHLYEGYPPSQAAFLVRVARMMGAATLVVTNAAGGLNPQYAVSDLMLIDDHINLMFNNPLVGPNDKKIGPRFTDMSAPYDEGLQQSTVELARRHGFPLHRGVYVGVLGPNYETRAEYRMCRTIGGDAVGMSTVPEVLAARHGGMRVLGLSVITNVGLPDALDTTSAHDVVSTASRAASKLTTIVRGAVGQLDASTARCDRLSKPT